MSFILPVRVAFVAAICFQLLNVAARADQNPPGKVEHSAKMAAAQKMAETVFSYDDFLSQMKLMREAMKKRRQRRNSQMPEWSPAQKVLLEEAFKIMTPIAVSIAVEKLTLDEIDLVTRIHGPVYQKLEHIFITDTPEILTKCRADGIKEPELEFPSEKLSAARTLLGSLQGIQTGNWLQDCVYNGLIVSFVQKLSMEEIQELIDIKNKPISQNIQNVLAEMKIAMDREAAHKIQELLRSNK